MFEYLFFCACFFTGLAIITPICDWAEKRFDLS